MTRIARATDVVLLAAVFAITFARLRWNAAGNNVYLSDLLVGLFLVLFLLLRTGRGDWRSPRVAGVLALFCAGFLVVYLVGFYNLETSADRSLFVKGVSKFVLHFAFLIAAVAHLAARSPRFYWQTLGAFVAGAAANAAYALLELVVAMGTGRFLDQLVIGPLTGDSSEGLSRYGAVGGVQIFRTNGFMLDPNHLGVVLVVPLMILLPLYLRLERGHPLRMPVLGGLALLTVAELATLSRSGAVGIVVGLAVLAIPYRRLLLSRRLLAPLGALAGVLLLAGLAYSNIVSTLVSSRLSLSGSGTQTHLDLYELLPPAIEAYPLAGRGLNTFSTYFEFLTGRTNWGPHSYYIAVLIESGILGALLLVAFLVWVFRRLGLLRRLGRALARAGDVTGARVQPLAWGLTAALAGTMAANAFYLTMQMYYFFVFLLLAVAAPIVFARRAAG